jgi:signal transduction histidine kinase
MRDARLLGVACLYVEDDLHPGSWELDAFRWLAQVTGVWMELVTTLTEHRDQRDSLQAAAWELLTTHQRTVVHEAVTGIGRVLATALPERLEAVAGELNAGSSEDLERRQRLAIMVLREINGVIDDLRRRVSAADRKASRPRDLNDLVRQAIEIVLSRWRAHADEGGTPVPVDFEASREPIRIDGSIALLGALAHAISNAVEAVPPGGRVHVRTHRESGNAIVRVADTGPGIPPDRRQDVFRPFTSTKSAGHMGLGLAVVRSSLERHGGEAVLAAAEDGGTVLHLRLPIVRAGTPQPAGA